ncbi:MAG: hypothetical protein ABSF21_01750 [Dehalococcoidia bacterium]
MLLELAVLKNFDSGTYKAAVQLAGSLTTYFDDVPVSRAIPTSALVIGNRVILAIPGDNPKDACVIGTWPQGSPGGAEVHGNEYHDPDFASEAALAAHAAANTGIHNVGSLYIAKSSVDGLNLASHKTRHQSGGADELSLADLKGVPIDAFPRTGSLIFFEMWKDIVGWTEAYVGSGYRSSGLTDLQLYTGATNNSRATLYITANPLDQPQYPGIKFFACLQSCTAQTAGEIRIFIVRNGEALAPLSDIGRHGGFKIINGEIWATTGDGTAETATDTGLNIAAAWSGRTIDVRGITNTSIQYYIDGVLKATHTTNLPSASNYRIAFEIKNTNAINQGIRIRPITYTRP